jgi:glycosyltransferase involved in cell wall biosynthesis
MSASSHRQDEAVVQIVGPTDHWVLERLARRLAAKLPYARFVPWRPEPGGTARLAYYVNYALYQGPSGLIDVAFFTHLDEAQQFLDRARAVDFCVSMSKLYADWLRGQGVTRVEHIPMGFDAYRYRPRLVLGVVGKLDHPRKGRHLVERLRQLPFVEVRATEGQVADNDLPDFYQGLDYVLIPATVEGGPMSLLEGLGMGKPVLAPEGVGMVPEFPANEHVLRYPAGDAEALVRLVTACYERKRAPSRLVEGRTWDRWAEDHHQLFVRLLGERGVTVPEPAAGFRFGLLAELEIPAGTAVEVLEAALDRAGTHLFYGRYGAARAAVEEVVPQYPYARKLLNTIPQGDQAAHARQPAPALARAKALR